MATLLEQPVLLATSGVLAAVGTSYLTTSAQFDVDQRRRAEWAAWGLLALGCRLSLLRRQRGQQQGGNAVTLGLRAGSGDKETQSRSWYDNLSSSSSSEPGVWSLALLLVGVQFMILRVGRASCQWIFVSLNCVLVFSFCAT